MTDIIKKMTVSYDTMEELLRREKAMFKTLNNYLARAEDYEFHQSYVSIAENKFKLTLEIKFKDGNN